MDKQRGSSVKEPKANDLLSFADIEKEGRGYPKKATLQVWKCVNRYGFRDIVIMVGGKSRIRRADWDLWLESRKLCGKAA